MFRITLKQLEYFVKVAEAGSLADAARELYISQPSISNAITKLEDSLDVNLFVRHHAQGVSLTSAGGRLLPEIRSLLTQTGELVRSAQGLRQEVQGRLHIGCFNPLASVYIPQLITEFRKQYPHADIRLYEENTERLISGLENNEFDMIITYQLYAQQTFTQEILATLKPYAIFPEDHPLCNKRKITISQLAQYPMVLLDLPRSREYFTALFETQNLYPNIEIKSPSFETVRALVANGAGFSILVTRPQHTYTYDGKRVVEKEISGDLPHTNIIIASLDRSRSTMLESVFVDFCKQFFATKK